MFLLPQKSMFSKQPQSQIKLLALIFQQRKAGLLKWTIVSMRYICRIGYTIMILVVVIHKLCGHGRVKWEFLNKNILPHKPYIIKWSKMEKVHKNVQKTVHVVYGRYPNIKNCTCSN